MKTLIKNINIKIILIHNSFSQILTEYIKLIFINENFYNNNRKI